MKRRAALLFCLLGTGCVQLNQPAPQIARYQFAYPAPQLALPPLPLILRIGKVKLTATYDHEPITYRSGRYTGDVYHYHRWISAPGTLVHDVLVRDFTSSGIYRAVQPGLDIVPADYEVSLYVDSIGEEPGDGTCRAALAARAWLIRLQPPKAPSYAAELPYQFDEAVPCNDPPALVAALSRVVGRLSERLQSDVHAALAATTTPPPAAPVR